MSNCISLWGLPNSLHFEPITTYSAHWIKDARFAKAIEQFLVREQKTMQHYKQSAASYLPFKEDELTKKPNSTQF